MTTEPARRPIAPMLSRRRVLGGAFAAGAAFGLRGPLGSSGAAMATPLIPEGPPTDTSGTTLLQEITAFADRAAPYVPGCAVASFDAMTGESGTYAVGWRDVGAGLPFETSTISYLESVSKAFTGLMFSQAVTKGLGRDGALELDAKVSTFMAPYLASFGLVMPPTQSDITLSQLANFSSGFLEEPSPYPTPSKNAYQYTQAELATWLSSPLPVDSTASSGLYRHAQPGQKYFYSDVAVDLLGFILCDQLVLPSSPGNPDFDTLVRQMLVGPDRLDMGDTFVRRPGVAADRAAIGYASRPDPTQPNGPYVPADDANDPPFFFGGGGGLSSTADDMVRLLQALVVPTARGGLDRAVPFSLQHGFAQTSGATGLGWDRVFPQAEVTIVLKNGGGASGASALLGFSPDTRRSLFFMTNIDGFFAEGASVGPGTDVETVFKRLLGETSPMPDAELSPARPASATPSFTG